MSRPSLTELERRCQKPDHRRIGNWMARRVARPAALRITWLVMPWGVSAHAATLAAWGFGVAAAAVLGWGTPGAWIAAAGLLQMWYLLDHVDGQLARLRGTDSLDGMQLDYLMHHTVHLLVPVGLGWGLMARHAEPWWMMAGLLWGVSLLVITLQHDARAKTLLARLKRVRGVLHVTGGAGGRPMPQPPIPRHPLRLAAWTARKSCEMHVVMNLLGLLAVTQWLLGDRALLAGRLYLAAAAPVAAIVAIWVVWSGQRKQLAENEFAAWFRVPRGYELISQDGWWEVVPHENGDSPPFQPEAQARE